MDKRVRNYNLDIARVLGIFAVTIYHAWVRMGKPVKELGIFDAYGFAHWGNVGVIIMFVLSGYLVVGSYKKLAIYSIKDRLKKFYVARFFRIAPAYYFAILVWCIFMYYGIRVKPHGIKDIISHVLFIHPYFSGTIYSVSGVFWYIGIQAAYFAVTPFVFYLWSKLNKVLKLDFKKRKILAVILWIIILLIGWQALANKLVVYHSFLYMLPSFLLGMLLYYLKDIKIPTVISVFCIISGVLMLFWRMDGLFSNASYRVVSGMLMSIGFIKLPPIRLNDAVKAPLLMISSASYTIYLYNYLVYIFPAEKGGMFDMLLHTAIVIGFGLLMYIIIEQPLTKMTERFITK